MPRVYIALGANLGDRQAHLDRARQALDALPATSVRRMSRVYETAPVGPQDQGPFLNAVAELATELTPQLLLEHTQRLEREAGRASRPEREPWGPRELDLDVLLFGHQRIDRPGLTVPHPHLHERWFVLRPLADLIPNRVPPGCAASVGAMLECLERESEGDHGGRAESDAGKPGDLRQPREVAGSSGQ